MIDAALERLGVRVSAAGELTLDPKRVTTRRLLLPLPSSAEDLRGPSGSASTAATERATLPGPSQD